MPISVTGIAVDLPVDWRSACRLAVDHQSAGADDHEHEVHQPEDRLTRSPRSADSCARLWITCAFAITAGTCPAFGANSEEGEDDDDDALSETEIEEGGLEAGACDHRLDRRDRQRRACAEARGGDAGGQAALVGKPFQRVADAGAVDAAGADAAR